MSSRLKSVASQGSHVAPFQHHLLRIALICLAPLGLLSLAAGYDDFRRVREQRSQEIHDLATRAAAAVESELQRHTQGLKALDAATSELPGGSLSAQHKAAQAFDKTFSAAALLVDDQGRVLVHSRASPNDPQAIRQMRVHQSSLASAMGTGKSTGGTLDSAVVREQGLPLVIAADRNHQDPRSAGHSHARHSWVTVLTTGHLRTALERVGLPAGARLALRDASGQIVVTHPHGKRIEGQADTARRFTRPIHASNWTVSAEMDAWPFYRPAIELPLSRGVLTQ